MTKTFYAVHYKKIWKDGSTTELGAKKDDIFKSFEEAAHAANKMNEHNWKFHQEKANNAFYFVVEIKIPKELLNESTNM